MHTTSIDPRIRLSRALTGLAALGLVACVAASAPRAFAACPTGTPAEELAQHPLVFVATVTALHDSVGANGAPLRHAQLHVRSTWKGWPGRTLSVTLGEAKQKNAVALSIAETYVVYADSVGDAVWIPECSRTAPVALAGDDVRALGEPAPIAPLPRRRSAPH